MEKKDIMKGLCLAAVVIAAGFVLLTNVASDDDSSADVLIERNWGDVTYVLDDSGTFTVTGTRMSDVPSGLDVPWYKYKTMIQRVIISDGVTNICANAFKDCVNLEYVYIGKDVNSFGAGCFRNCTKIAQVDYNARNASGVVNWGGDAHSIFSDAGKDVEGFVLNLGSTVEAIQTYVFTLGKSCGSCIRELNISEGLKSVGNSAFSHNRYLESLVLPDSLTSVGIFAFSDCTSLKSVKMGAGLQSTSQNMFNGCTALTDITFGANLKVINMNTFQNCTALTNLEFPDQIDTIGRHAFSGCTSLMTVDFGKGVRWVRESVFENCTSLISISGGDGIDSFKNTFIGCINLESVYIGSSLTWIRDGAFSGCNNIQSITFAKSNGTLYIDKGALFVNLYDFYENPLYKSGYKYEGTSLRGHTFDGTFSPDPHKKLIDPIASSSGSGMTKDKLTSTETEIRVIDVNDYTYLSEANMADIRDAANNNKNVVFELSNGKLVLDPASAASLGLEIEAVYITDADLSEYSSKLIDAVGDRPVYTVAIGNTHNFGGKITVTLNYELRENEDANDLCIWYLKEDGTYETIPCTYNDGKVTFVTDHLSDYAIMSVQSNEGIGMIPAICVIAAIALLCIMTVVICARENAKN